MPSAASTSSFLPGEVMTQGDSPHTTSRGLRSKVRATEGTFRLAASFTHSDIIAWWPRCTPSKTPMVTTEAEPCLAKSLVCLSSFTVVPFPVRAKHPDRPRRDPLVVLPGGTVKRDQLSLTVEHTEDPVRRDLRLSGAK